MWHRPNWKHSLSFFAWDSWFGLLDPGKFQCYWNEMEIKKIVHGSYIIVGLTSSSIKSHLLDQIFAKNSNQSIRWYIDDERSIVNRWNIWLQLNVTFVGKACSYRPLIGRLNRNCSPNVAVVCNLQFKCFVGRWRFWRRFRRFNWCWRRWWFITWDTFIAFGAAIDDRTKWFCFTIQSNGCRLITHMQIMSFFLHQIKRIYRTKRIV